MDLTELNIFYRKTIFETIGLEEDGTDYTLDDFGKACEVMQLPFFEVKEENNPFAEPHSRTETKIYQSYKEFRKSMPEWSAREYDYENDRPTWYYQIKGISSGYFELSASNSSCNYKWFFVVTDTAVLVKTIYTLTD